MTLMTWIREQFHRPITPVLGADISAYFRKRRQIREKARHDALGLAWCQQCGKLVFDDQRESCVIQGHNAEPLIGKLFTESDLYFEEIEREADMWGDL